MHDYKKNPRPIAGDYTPSRPPRQTFFDKK